jgi:hypothetical protein
VFVLGVCKERTSRFAFPKDAPHRQDARLRSVYIPPAGSTPEVAKHSGSFPASSQLLDGPSRRSDASLVLADLTFDGEAGSPQNTGRASADAAAWQDVQSYMHHYSTVDATRIDPSMEGDHWVPEEALDLAGSFKRKHLSHVPPSLIREFLLELNQVWRRRFNKQCAAVKDRCGCGC